MDLSPDTLVYIQKVVNFLKTNVEARDYFLKNIDDEMFWKRLSEIAEDNYIKKGNPMLDREQFESIRESVLNIKKNKIDISFNLNDFGTICLN